MKEPSGLFKQAPEKKNIPLFHRQSLIFSAFSSSWDFKKYSDFFLSLFHKIYFRFSPAAPILHWKCMFFFASLDKRMPLYHYVHQHFCQIAFLPPISSVLHTFRPICYLWGSVHPQVFVGTASAGLLDS